MLIMRWQKGMSTKKIIFVYASNRERGRGERAVNKKILKFENQIIKIVSQI